MLTYGDGPAGFIELREALARFINLNFNPCAPVKLDHVNVIAGIGPIIDELGWCLCDEGEGILIGRPLYAGFVRDLETRAG